jgi:hypothetical protein
MFAKSHSAVHADRLCVATAAILHAVASALLSAVRREVAHIE